MDETQQRAALSVLIARDGVSLTTLSSVAGVAGQKFRPGIRLDPIYCPGPVSVQDDVAAAKASL